MTAYYAMQEPTFWDPDPSAPGYRFALGRVPPAPTVGPPLISICMNPSYANERESDKTVNRIIEASIDLGYTGWIVLNLYPERATKSRDLSGYNPALSAANCAAITKVLTTYGAIEVLGAWGGTNKTIRRAKTDVRATLVMLRVKVFHLDDLTKSDEPRHPTPRTGRLPMVGPKRYLTW